MLAAEPVSPRDEDCMGVALDGGVVVPDAVGLTVDVRGVAPDREGEAADFTDESAGKEPGVWEICKDAGDSGEGAAVPTTFAFDSTGLV